VENIESLIIQPNVYYTIKEAAQLLRISPKMLLKILQSKRARGIKIGRKWRILGKSLLDLTASDEEQALLVSDWLNASKSTLSEIWDNEEDAIYDQI
jgi:excisionase family DNA binding protein